MVLKVTAPKESPKQSLAKVTWEAAVCSCSSEQMLIEILQYSLENICVGVFFLIKLHDLRPATLFKRDFNTGVFLWILRNFYEQLFLQNASGGCFCRYHKVTALFTNGHLPIFSS